MNSITAKITASVGSLVLMPLVGCAGSGGSSDAAGPIVAVIVDQTCDASAELTASARAAIEESVRFAAAGGGTFLGTPVTTDTYQDTAYLVRHTFASAKRNHVARRRDLDRQAKAFLTDPGVKALGEGHRRGSSCGSDLLTTLAAAKRAVAPLTGAKSGRAVTIVLATNGLVVQGNTDFLHDPLAPKDIDAIITEVKTQGLLPDLRGVTVDLVGVGMDTRIPAAQTRAVERFWADFVTATGGEPHLSPTAEGLVFAGEAQ